MATLMGVMCNTSQCTTQIKIYCIVLYCIVLYCIVLYCIVLYCIVLYCIVLYCIVLYCIVLYCIVCELRSLRVNSGMLNVIRIVTYYTLPPLELSDSFWIAMAFSR